MLLRGTSDQYAGVPHRYHIVSFGGTLLQQIVGIPMGTNCAPLLAAFFLSVFLDPDMENIIFRHKFS